jgi:hypothetical protein
MVEDFVFRARLGAASEWYDPLSSDELRHLWLYFDSEVQRDGLSVRRIPRQVTDELASAKRRDCFTSYVVRCNREHQQYVVVGVLTSADDEKYYPVVAWHPTDTPIPTAEELKAHAEEIAAREEESKKQVERQRAQMAAESKERRREVRRIRRIAWTIAAITLSILNGVLFVAAPLTWSCSTAFITTCGVWLMFEATSSPSRAAADVRKRFALSFIALHLVVGSMALAALWP